MTDGSLQDHFSAVRRQVVKWRHYFPIYEQLLDKYRGRPITVVEVGVAHGGSLEAWRSYFGPAARIIGIDLDPATRALERDGFEILIGDQSDPAFWRRVLPAIGPIDVLIDDGGHASVEQIVTAAGALPHIADGGIIIVEDTHSAYMPKHYPAPRRFGLMAFAQHVVDAMHARHPLVSGAAADSAGLGRAIHSVQFFDSLVVFHVDRRLCATAEWFEAGREELPLSDVAAATTHAKAVAAFDAQPKWLRQLLQPARLAAGSVIRAAKRRSAARRVQQFFR